MKTFSITESFKFGWNKLKAHSRLVFSATLILAAIQLLVRLTTPEQSSVPAAGIMIFGAIIEVVLGTGFTIIALKLARGEHTTFREIIPSGRLLWQYIATAVLVGLMMLVCVGIPVGVGVLLMLGGGGISGLVIGGIIGGAIAILIVLRYFFIKIVSIDGVRPIKEILSTSAKLSDGIKWQLLLFLLVIALINILGALTVVGLLLTIPITLFAMTHVYLKLLAPSQTPAATVSPSSPAIE